MIRKLKHQVEFDLHSFERATARLLTDEEKAQFRQVQLQANRWTVLGTVMTQTLPPLAAAFNRADETAQTERNGEWLTVCLAFASAQRIVSRR